MLFTLDQHVSRRLPDRSPIRAPWYAVQATNLGSLESPTTVGTLKDWASAKIIEAGTQSSLSHLHPSSGQAHSSPSSSHRPLTRMGGGNHLHRIPQGTPLSGQARSRPSFLWNPDFYYNQAPKPHSRLKKAQTTLREKQLSYKLLLGGESDNPTSKGIPQPPLWRRSVRGALCEARPRGWLTPFTFPRSFGFR